MFRGAGGQLLGVTNQVLDAQRKALSFVRGPEYNGLCRKCGSPLQFVIGVSGGIDTVFTVAPFS